jgi:hypothetical protein
VKSCGQVGCDYPALFRFTWPDKDEAYACPMHAAAAIEIAKAVGLHLQVIPLVEEIAVVIATAAAELAGDDDEAPP